MSEASIVGAKEAALAAWESMGESGARDPVSWQLAADTSWYAANVLRERHLSARAAAQDAGHDPAVVGSRLADFLVLRTAALLGGLALEALLKGLLIRSDESAVEHPSFYSHDLTKLARRVGLTLSSEETALLGHLHEAVVWWGRYPVTRWDSPRNRERFSKGLRVDDEGAILGDSLPGTISDPQWSKLESLMERATTRFERPVADEPGRRGSREAAEELEG